MKKRILLGTVFLLCIFLSGCWDRVELNEKAIVSGCAVDKGKGDEEIKLTVQTILPGGIKQPTGSGGEGEAVLNITSTGKTIFDAIRNFGLESGRKGLWAHSKVVVIGEAFAKEGVDEIIDFFERDHDIRRRVWVVISKGEAKDVIETKTMLEKIPAYHINSLVQAYGITSKVPTVDIQAFSSKLSSKTTSPIAPGIETYTPEGAEENRLRLTDTAVFKDYKLIGWLNKDETRGLLWATGKVQSGMLQVPCENDEKKSVTIEIISASGKMKPEINNENIIITVEIKEDGGIGTLPANCGDVVKPESIEKLEKEKEKAIKKEVDAAVKKAQELNTDVFGFGEAIYRKYPKEWKELEGKWDKIFPSIKVVVKVDAKIINTGILHKASEPE